MDTVLADMSRAFRDPVDGAQRSFRALLDAMAHPGSERELPAAALAGIEPPASCSRQRPMSLGMTAVLLTLLDAETMVRLAGSLASAEALAYLRFHTGVRAAWIDDRAPFNVARAADVDDRLWSRLDLGTDESPQRGATLIVEVDALGSAGTRLHLRGPGIPAERSLDVDGLSRDFWLWRTRLQSELPRGVDLVLVCGTRLAAIPRSTRITLGL
ncbi:phosphonate C-P lyase system protein PhnH [Piscinibacter sp. XHJ-5]|uniref:phosphonate C-P lyase system protein PhnH n=1 Tax=Piscinibacter sp. XHJ-5 TaxID=3037797 RepID=UPI002452931D|nr:phosphonate C-P lyase system protein PhnH [Piscinibacter sp. XHJ-5]